MAQRSIDQFIVRTPANSCAKASSGSVPRQRQARIEDLRGVVVVEQIERLKALLECETQTKDEMIANLNKVRKKIPSREVLQKTRIGITLNNLRKHKDPEIAKLAQEIRSEWKLYFKEKLERPMIEVKSDEKTEKTRRNAKQMLAQSLKLDDDHNIVNALEKEVFHRKNRLLNGPYQRTIRSLTFALRNKEDVREQVASGEMGIGDFITNFEKT